MHDPEADYIGPIYHTLGSVPDLAEAKHSLWRLLFARYEASAVEIKAIQDALSADQLDGRRCATTIPGIIEQLRGGEYLIPLGVKPPLIVNWLCHHIWPGAYTEERRMLALWLQEALKEARQRAGATQ
jgi:hypothetical protein